MYAQYLVTVSLRPTFFFLSGVVDHYNLQVNGQLDKVLCAWAVELGSFLCWVYG